MEAAAGAETPSLSAPATLFAGPRVDSLSYERKSMPRCKCLPVEAWMSPRACVVEIPAPDVSLARKVRLAAMHVHIVTLYVLSVSICWMSIAVLVSFRIWNWISLLFRNSAGRRPFPIQVPYIA